MITAFDRDCASTLAAIERFNAALNRHDIHGVMAALTEDCSFESTGPAPEGGRYYGAQATRALWERFFRANPLARLVVEEQFATGDRGVVRWRYDWGDGHIRGVALFRVQGGRISEKLWYVKGSRTSRRSLP